MSKTTSLLATGILALFSAAAIAAPLPAEIYRPTGAQTIKAERQSDGEFEYEAELSARRTSVPALAKKVIAHARSKGFRMVESEIRHDDADLKFTRRNQKLEVSIENDGDGRIEYHADLDLDDDRD